MKVNFDQYKEIMQNEYFSVCSSNSVLEIGPYIGIHTKLIIDNNPEFLELIDANPINLEELQKISDIDNIIIDDVLFTLQQPKHYDVVVCCGMLYHLHCPLYLLELIVNHSSPEWIILDCKKDVPELNFIVEPDNITKNRFTRDNWNSSKFSIVAPFEIINLAMNNMNYQLIKQSDVQVWDYRPKVDTWIGLWRKM
jgi:hypothetical protein